MFRGIINSVSRLKKRLLLHPSEKRLIASFKKRWPNPRYGKKAVILIDIFDWNPYIYCSAHASHYLSERLDASIETFSFADGLSNQIGFPFRRLERIFESFGCPLTLRKTNKTKKPFEEEAQAMFDAIFPTIKTKMDVFKITFDGKKVGHVIYDTYLRRTGDPTIDLKDKKLKKYIYEACVNWLMIKDFFAKRDVKAIFTSHFVYIECGLLTCYASYNNIPVFVFHNLEQLNISAIQVENNFLFRPHWRFKEIFAGLTDQEKKYYVESSKKVLEDRLAGFKDIGTTNNLAEGTPDLSGYGPHSDKPILKNTGRPRVLILLNCFFDAPHTYRSWIFADHWEWINHLLTHASKTEFDWYVKPHPSGMLRNDDIVAKLKKKYPKINFLERTSSNSQIVKEGINCMFTTYGTAAHEFAYMGIPVVTAGDNPHSEYNFNFHPKTEEEYTKFIETAGHLKIDIDKNEVLEFFGINYIYSYKPNKFGARLIDSAYDFNTLGQAVNLPTIFDRYLETESAAKEAKVKDYYDDFFRKFYFQERDSKPKVSRVTEETSYQKGP